MTKRLLELISYEDLSIDELDHLASEVKEMVEKKRKLSPAEDILERGKAMLLKYNEIEYGSSWNTEETFQALSKLSDIMIFPLFNATLLLQNNDELWKIGMELTTIASGIISDADSNAEEFVNGVSGDWCQEQGGYVEDFWKSVLKSGREPSSLVGTQLLQDYESFQDILGEYGELTRVVKKLKKLQPAQPELLSPQKNNCDDDESAKVDD